MSAAQIWLTTGCCVGPTLLAFTQILAIVEQLFRLIIFTQYVSFTEYTFIPLKMCNFGFVCLPCVGEYRTSRKIKSYFMMNVDHKVTF